MDIGILLALQDFRNGSGAFLADFLSKMTYLGELKIQPAHSRDFSRELAGFYFPI